MTPQLQAFIEEIGLNVVRPHRPCETVIRIQYAPSGMPLGSPVWEPETKNEEPPF